MKKILIIINKILILYLIYLLKNINNKYYL